MASATSWLVTKAVTVKATEVNDGLLADFRRLKLAKNRIRQPRGNVSTYIHQHSHEPTFEFVAAGAAGAGCANLNLYEYKNM
jgi:hypothetical protein